MARMTQDRFDNLIFIVVLSQTQKIITRTKTTQTAQWKYVIHINVLKDLERPVWQVWFEPWNGRIWKKQQKSNLSSRMLWSIVSKAFCVPVISPSPKPFRILSFKYERQVSVERFVQKPDWYLYILWYIFWVWSHVTFSIILEIKGRSEIGLYFFGSVVDHLLNNVFSSAILRFSGNADKYMKSYTTVWWEMVSWCPFFSLVFFSQRAGRHGWQKDCNIYHFLIFW